MLDPDLLAREKRRSDPSGRLHCTPLHIAALQSSTEAGRSATLRPPPKPNPQDETRVGDGKVFR